MVPRLRTFVTLLVLVTLVAGPAGARIVTADLSWEAEEDARQDLDALGQRNCVGEALASRSTASCPLEPTGAPHRGPAAGIRLLDTWPTTWIGAPNPGEPTKDPSFATNVGGYGWNSERGGADVLGDVIFPGAVRFFSWYGWWNDLDGDRILDIREHSSGWPKLPDHEWVEIPTSLFAYVEPGSHPGVASRAPAESFTPDLWLDYRNISYPHHEQRPAPGPVVFLDGSLLETYLVTTVSEGLAAPEEGRAYTVSDRSLVDVDRHVAVAPSPIQALYAATAGPLVSAIGSPTAGSCPNDCRSEAPPLGGTSLESQAGSAYSRLYASYPAEHGPGSMNTAEGRHARHVDAYAPWTDLVPRAGYGEGSAFVQATAFHVRATQQGAVAGTSSDGRMAFLPGAYGFEIWFGTWRDLNEDGFVGSAYEGNAYESGTRPLPHDYYNSAGEFMGTVASSGQGAMREAVFVTLVPDGDWGPLGVRFVGYAGGSQAAPEGGTQPILLRAGVDARAPGLYMTPSLYFPEGSRPTGFTACVDWAFVRYHDGERDVLEPVRDCDRIERLA